MKTLLLNGCSFAKLWEVSDNFTNSLGCDTVINLGRYGTSFQRSCRSTIEWIAQNGAPEYVVIPITFAHRWELALNNNEDDIDGSWVPLQNSNFLSDSFVFQGSSVEEIKKLCDQYYKVIPTIKTHWDKLFTDLITFTAFLRQLQIPYLMFDMCNGFDKIHIDRHRAFEKIKFIEQDKRVIDIWKFCGNRFMRDTMVDEVKRKTPEFAHHHAPVQLRHLENYLIDYVQTNL
tara:strand:+ start:660 stop:1352 length:693 start_codon:yes stop_codon:yes gene_type:complete